MSYVSWFTKMKPYTDAWLDKSQRHAWTLADQEWYDATKSINPFIGMYRDRKIREWYMDRYNYDWNDVTQPWNLPGGSDAGGYSDIARRGLNFVSSNLSQLYGEEHDYKERKKQSFYAYQDAWH